MSEIKFSVVRGAAIPTRVNHATGVTIRKNNDRSTSRGAKYDVLVPNRLASHNFDYAATGVSMEYARHLATEKVEMMLAVIAEAFDEAMSEAHTDEPIMLVEDNHAGLIRLRFAGLPNRDINIVRANRSWYLGADGVTIGVGRSSVAAALSWARVWARQRIAFRAAPAAPAAIAEAHSEAITDPAHRALATARPKRTQHYSHALTPLVVGETVRGISFGVTPTGRLSYLTPWEGVYEGERASEWDGEPVHFYSGGFIGDVPQACFALPVAQYV